MKTTISTSIAVFLCFTAFAQWNYPTTKKVAVSDTYHGITYTDNYRWLEDMKDPEVETWFQQQADFSNATMNAINGRDELIAEWRKLDALQPATFSDIKKVGGRIFFKKRMPGDNVGKIYYRETMDGEDILLFDPLNFKEGKVLSVENFIPSYDGKKLLIGYSESGAEIAILQVLDLDSKRFLKDSIPAARAALGWTLDSSAFMYLWLKSTDNKDPEGKLNPKTKLHKLGTDYKTDIDFFSNEAYPNLTIPSKAYPYISLSKNVKDYVFSGQGTVADELVLYYAPISQFYSGTIEWKTFCTAADKLINGSPNPGAIPEVFGTKVYAITYKGAEKYKLIATAIENPDWANAETVVAEKDMSLTGYTRSKDFLLLNYSDGINSHLFKFNPKTKTSTKVNLPFSGAAQAKCLDTKTNDFIIEITSWNKPLTEYFFDADTEKFTASIFNQPPVYPAEYNDLVVEEVEVKGHDGVLIPLSIIYKKGTKKDGSNICFMRGYGAYGTSMTPYFSSLYNAMVTKGVVYAVPHVRGGGEKGEAWYKAGFKTTKPNTWKDFISCAEYLIDQGFTQPSKLSGMGTSAGGILIGRAITERPDLFSAAICNVGVTNTIRKEFSANGPINIPEYGTMKDPTEAKALYEMDGVQHVKAGVSYPAVIAIGGWNDPRVPVWQPGKFAAALQNSSTSGKPVFMKVNYDNGHFTEDREVTWSNFADQFAFVLWQTGHPDFQLKK